MPEHQNIKQSRGTQSSQRQIIPAKQIHVSSPAAIIQRARIDPKSLTSADVLQLQRTIGNRAVGRLLSGVSNSFTAQQVPVQRQEMPEEEETCPSCVQKHEIQEEKEPLQGMFENKPEKAMCSSCVQRKEIPEEEEHLQMKKENNTGMPDNLKAGVESLSGIDMSDVRVHYNSSKPAGIGALAYTQGTNIHIAPGREKHLPHETWHVVQQAQGRVRPTMQLKDVAVNDEEGLEKEADEMANAALRVKMVQKNGNSRGKDLLRISSLKLNFSTPVQGFFYYNTEDQQMSDYAKSQLIKFFENRGASREFSNSFESPVLIKFEDWFLKYTLTPEEETAIYSIIEEDLGKLLKKQEVTPPRTEEKREVPYEGASSPPPAKKQAMSVSSPEQTEASPTCSQTPRGTHTTKGENKIPCQIVPPPPKSETAELMGSYFNIIRDKRITKLNRDLCESIFRSVIEDKYQPITVAIARAVCKNDTNKTKTFVSCTGINAEKFKNEKIKQLSERVNECLKEDFELIVRDGHAEKQIIYEAQNKGYLVFELCTSSNVCKEAGCKGLLLSKGMKHVIYPQTYERGPGKNKDMTTTHREFRIYNEQDMETWYYHVFIKGKLKGTVTLDKIKGDLKAEFKDYPPLIIDRAAQNIWLAL